MRLSKEAIEWRKQIAGNEIWKHRRPGLRAHDIYDILNEHAASIGDKNFYMELSEGDIVDLVLMAGDNADGDITPPQSIKDSTSPSCSDPSGSKAAVQFDQIEAVELPDTNGCTKPLTYDNAVRRTSWLYDCEAD